MTRLGNRPPKSVLGPGVGGLYKCFAEKAVQLMREKPDLLLKDIARIVGFEDQAYFSRVFKRAKGVTPADFRDGGAQQ